jgi:hypothetical protein
LAWHSGGRGLIGGRLPGRSRWRRRRRFLAGKQDVANLNRRVRLAVAAQPTVILSAAEVLNVKLLGRMIDDFGCDVRAWYERLPYLAIVAAGEEQHARELDPRAYFRCAVVDAHHVAFTHLILPRSVFEDCVHG